MLEELTDKALAARDDREIARLRELLRQHPAANPRVVRLSEKLDRPDTAPADRGDSAGRRLAILGIARLDSGDEFGAYLLARSARAEWQAASPWWTSNAVKTLMEDGPTKFPLQDRVTYDAARAGIETVPDEVLNQALAQNTHERWSRGVVRIFCENEGTESRLFVEGERGCVVLRGRGASSGGEYQSGDVVVVANSPQVPGSPRLRISGLRHHAAEIEPRFSRAGSYWGAIVLRELPASELGELRIRLDPEPGMTSKELADLSLRIGPSLDRMVSVPEWTVNPESRDGEVLRIVPRTYSFQVYGPQAASALETRNVSIRRKGPVVISRSIPIYRRRQLLIEWKFRSSRSAEILEGSETVLTGASLKMVGWGGQAANVTLRVSDWGGRSCNMGIDNAFSAMVPDADWNRPLRPVSRNWVMTDAPIMVGRTIILENSIRGSEAFLAMIHVREITVPAPTTPSE